MIQLLKPLEEKALQRNFLENFEFPFGFNTQNIFQLKKNSYEVKLKNNNKYFFLMVIPFQDLENYEQVDFLVLLQDITDKKKVELEKKEQEEFLLHQSRFAAIGESLAAIAHQWKQPLQSIQLMAFYLKEIYNDVETHKDQLVSLANDILEQVNFLNQTLQNFRDFYKDSEENISFSIREEILKVIQILKYPLEQNQISINVSKEDFIIFGNPNLFKQCIINLINNSKDALLEIQKRKKDFQGKISIEIYPDKKIIKISDNGGGIPKEIQKKLFMPYVSTKKSEGSGLGLYITKRILNKIKGDIYYSEILGPERGACFNIKFS
ncbi:MAG: sensor histidine kinase [Leptonema sp. (in: bacteria)]